MVDVNPNGDLAFFVKESDSEATVWANKDNDKIVEHKKTGRCTIIIHKTTGNSEVLEARDFDNAVSKLWYHKYRKKD